MKIVEVFKTDVRENVVAEELVSLLQQHFPNSKINFDLEDCDKILRVEGANFTTGKVMQLVNEHGFKCAVLE